MDDLILSDQQLIAESEPMLHVAAFDAFTEMARGMGWRYRFLLAYDHDTQCSCGLCLDFWRDEGWRKWNPGRGLIGYDGIPIR